MNLLLGRLKKPEQGYNVFPKSNEAFYGGKRLKSISKEDKKICRVQATSEAHSARADNLRHEFEVAATRHGTVEADAKQRG